MKIFAICIGSELLNGQTLNTNVHAIGDILSKNGYQLAGEILIPDDLDQMVFSIKQQMSLNDMIMIVGGLGPTVDDITRNAVSLATDIELETSPEVYEGLKNHFVARATQPNEDYFIAQAEILKGAKILSNNNGLAPGLWLEEKNKHIVLFPGPPREIIPMVENEFMPILKKIFSPQFLTKAFYTYGLSESRVELLFKDYLHNHSYIIPAYCANLGCVTFRITVEKSHEQEFNNCIPEIQKILGNHALIKHDNIIGELADLLNEKNWTMATAESCTGGSIAGKITDFPGSSKFFKGSIVSYSNEWKNRFLNVKPETLEEFGAVSEETVQEMVRTLIDDFQCDAAIAITGIAGPDGGSDEKPVGLVYIAIAVQNFTKIHKCHFNGQREAIKTQTIHYALNQLRLEIIHALNV